MILLSSIAGVGKAAPIVLLVPHMIYFALFMLSMTKLLRKIVSKETTD